MTTNIETSFARDWMREIGYDVSYIDNKEFNFGNPAAENLGLSMLQALTTETFQSQAVGAETIREATPQNIARNQAPFVSLRFPFFQNIRRLLRNSNDRIEQIRKFTESVQRYTDPEYVTTNVLETLGQVENPSNHALDVQIMRILIHGYRYNRFGKQVEITQDSEGLIIGIGDLILEHEFNKTNKLNPISEASSNAEKHQYYGNFVGDVAYNAGSIIATTTLAIDIPALEVNPIIQRVSAAYTGTTFRKTSELWIYKQIEKNPEMFILPEQAND